MWGTSQQLLTILTLLPWSENPMQSEKRKNVLFASLLLLSSLLLSAIAVSPVRAAGALYVSPASITSQPIGANITYQVKVANMDPFNGWDIMVSVTGTILTPRSLSITPNLLSANFSATVFELINCVNGGAGVTLGQPGNRGCTVADGPGIVHSAAAVLGPPPQGGPSSGLLFTLGYRVAATGTSLVHIFNDIISNGTPTPVAHTTIDGVYGPPLKPDYSVGVQPTLAVLNQGSSRLVNVTVTRIGNFSGTVSLKVATKLPFGVSSSFSVTSGTPTFTSLLTLTASATATLGTTTVSVQAFNKTTSRTANFTLTVAPPPPPDFTIRAASTFISLVAGSSGNTSIILTSVNGFAGTVTLSSTVFPIVTSGPTASANPTSVTLTSGATVNSQLRITTTLGTPAGGYNVTVTGTSGSLSHSVVMSLAVTPVPDFGIIAFPSSLTVPRGSFAQANIRLFSNTSFTGVVTLTTSVFPSGPAVSLSSSSVTLTAFGSAQLSLTVTAGSFVALGNYTVTVTGTSGSLSHSALLSVQVINPTPDFTIAASPGFLSIPQGITGTLMILVTSLNGFSGVVTVSAFSSPFGLPLFVTPSLVTLASGANASSTLTIPTTATTPTGNYTVTVIGTASGLSHSSMVRVFVTPSFDKPPVANFTFTPATPTVGQTVLFDGSGSFDPDGSVVDWSWNFGDGFISFGTFTSHVYASPGNFTVTLKVTDNAGLSAGKSVVVPVHPKLTHDVAIVSIEVFPKVAVSSQFVNIEVRLINNGLFNETVSLTAFYDGHVIRTVNNIFMPVPNCRFFFCQTEVFVEVNWDTFGVAPGNYTISATVFLATDQHPADNSLSDGQVTILPPPVLTLSPSNGGLGTKVLVHGSGFPTAPFFFGPTQVFVTFDDMFLGFIITQNGSFNFTFDIPHAEPGVHLVKAFDTFGGARALTSFQVLAEQGTRSLLVSVDVGTVYFPGDTATIFILTSMNGVPAGPPGLQLQVSLFKPDGSMVTLNPTSIAPGLFKASFTVPKTGSLGTYAILASGHTPDSLNASSLGSFEVKPSWLNGQGQTVMTAAAIAGVAGVLALAWRRGYLRRRNEEFPSPSF